jgi:DNA topoisomerase-1
VSAAKSVVIVESPAKAKTIAGFLGPSYVVESSIGHIRDLPKSASDVPDEHRGTELGRLGVDVNNDFKPLYVVDAGKKAHLKKLKDLVRDASELYLATDEDREGESIAWHLLEVLKPKVPVKRLAFHEITKKAILAAMDHPRDIDRRLVDAQEARRILDRLYGYEVSPVLWKKVMPKLSAGRVQSVATRIIVEREAARIRFVSASYWDVEGEFAAPNGAFSATLTSYDGKRVATGKDFDENGKLGGECVRVDQATADKLVSQLPNAAFSVGAVERKANRRSPAPPFMTSTLQQEAGRKLRFSAQRAMRAAQSLYEGGYITYMRTDSQTLSETAINAARTLIKNQYGAEYLPSAPRVYKSKVKNAQEAHEAIRPAGDSFRPPDQVQREVGEDEARLYELIWKRTVASQMEDSRGQSVKLPIRAKVEGTPVEFSASGYTITFPGFLRAYVEGSDDPEVELEDKERPLPAVEEGDLLKTGAFVPKGHETQPPARFTEASLVKRLEELGVGRPSTYASIISTIQARGYVWKKGTALVPSFKAFAVVGLLEQHFGSLVDYSFTARMEDELDSIANGDQESVPWLKQFYFGGEPNGSNGKHEPLNGESKDRAALRMGLRKLVAERLGEIDARAVNSLPLGKDSDGQDVVIRVGRYGPYLQRGEETANIPDDLPPDELTLEKADELLKKPSGDRLLGTDPATSLPVYARAGRFGGYIQLGEAGGKEKPRTGSLLSTMNVESLTLEDALKMLSLPRLVGNDPDSSAPITAQIGRYGAYLTRNGESRSLEKDSDVFEVTLDHALELFKQPKTRGRKKSNEPIKEVGPEPNTGALITLREGRFGLYVTDGTTNASLRKGDTVENITPERAHELLEARRERAGTAPPKKKKISKKKAAAADDADEAGEGKPASSKKAPAKKTAAKTTTAKKTAAKKTADADASDDDETPKSKAAPKKVAPKKAASKSKPDQKAPVSKKGADKAPPSKAPASKAGVIRKAPSKKK